MYPKAGIKTFSQKMIISQYLNEEEEEEGRGRWEQIPSVGLSSPFTCHFRYYLKLEIFLHSSKAPQMLGLYLIFWSSHKEHSRSALNMHLLVSFLVKVLLSHVRLFWDHMTVSYQAPLSMGFSRQEYWSGLSLPSPEDLPKPGIEPGSPALHHGY